MKKAKYGFLISFTILSFFILPLAATSADWVYYTEAKDQWDCYYDTTSIAVTADKTIKVWTKEIYSEMGKNQVVLARKKRNISIAGFENLSYSIGQLEINCKAREYDSLSTKYYTENGNIIHSVDYPKRKKGEWASIAPDSIAEGLFNKVCLTWKKK